MRALRSSWRPAPWPEARSGRPRVLIENDDGGELWADSRTLRAAGFDVATCGGPSAHDGEPCELVTTGRCRLLEGADVVVNGLRLGDPQNREVIEMVTDAYPGVPVIVEVDPQQHERHHRTLAGCHTVPYPMSSAELVAYASAVR